MTGAAIVPLSGSGWNNTIIIDGQPRKPFPNFNSVGPRYFETLQIELVAGRLFDDRDTLNAPRVAIVDEAFGQAFFQTPNPIGREFHVDVAPGDPNPAYRIVGSSGTRSIATCARIRTDGYFPNTQDPIPFPTSLCSCAAGRPRHRAGDQGRRPRDASTDARELPGARRTDSRLARS